jgi:predicted transcriptional regulator
MRIIIEGNSRRIHSEDYNMTNRRRKRNKTEMIALILEAINHNTRATQMRIMYEAYMSYAQLQKYLSLMLETGFLEYQKGERVYKTTEKGKHFLHVYNEISSEMSLPF